MHMILTYRTFYIALTTSVFPLLGTFGSNFSLVLVIIANCRAYNTHTISMVFYADDLHLPSGFYFLPIEHRMLNTGVC